jgi:thiaminase
MASTRFTEALREAAGEQWDRVITHKFTKELAAGTINRSGAFFVGFGDA